VGLVEILERIYFLIWDKEYNKRCHYCQGSGTYTSLETSRENYCTEWEYVSEKCRHCSGKGYVDEKHLTPIGVGVVLGSLACVVITVVLVCLL
jgi:hypothetical protein